MKGSVMTKRTFACLAIILFSIITLSSSSFAATKWLSTIDSNVNVPTRLAIDPEGNIYVTEPRTNNRLLVFDRHGNLIKRLSGLNGPIGVALDGNKNIYVGNADTGNVSVYANDLTYSQKLGTGDGEFKVPSAIAVSVSGLIYVADSKDNIIKVYNPDGSSAFSFGGWGTGNGQFNVPLDIAIDESAGEIYIADLGIYIDPVNGKTAGARIQVFNLNGGYIRSFGQYGLGEGRLLRPLGIAFKDGKVYVSDGFQAVVNVYNANGNFIESISDAAHQLKTPIGVAVGKDGRVFVASSNGPSIEIFGLPGYTTMSIAPLSVSIEAEEGITPAAQASTISNTGEGILNWTAAADQAWIDISTASGTTQPATATEILIGIKMAGLTAGTYAGKITVTAETGATDTIAVNLTVVPQSKMLSVRPSSISFKAQKGGNNPAAQMLTIENLGKGDLSWTASTNQPWLSLNTTSGAAPSTASVNVNTTSLSEGTYTGEITVDAPGAQGSPAKVNVTLSIVNAGTLKVTTNLATGGFEITGPISYSGTGTEWNNSETVPGDYTITFNHVTGYIKPYTRTFTVATGKETAIDAQYKTKSLATHIISGSGGSGNSVIVLPLDNSASSSFTPFASKNGVAVAAGNVDASGIDNIVVTDNTRTIKVYTVGGVSLASYVLPSYYSGVEIAVGDIDNDGRADIIGCVNNRGTSTTMREIKLFGYSNGKIEDKGTLFTENKNTAFAIAIGDINGDGKAELLISDSSAVRAFSIDMGAANKLTELWSVNQEPLATGASQIAAGDINDDGIAEIALSVEMRGQNPDIVKMLKGTGEEYLKADGNTMTIDAFGDLGYRGASTIVLGDSDGDGVDEIIAGAGNDDRNKGLIRIYESDGTFTNTTLDTGMRRFGANIAIGRFK